MNLFGYMIEQKNGILFYWRVIIKVTEYVGHRASTGKGNQKEDISREGKRV